MQTDDEWQRGKSKFVSINTFKQTVTCNDERSSGGVVGRGGEGRGGGGALDIGSPP